MHPNPVPDNQRLNELSVRMREYFNLSLELCSCVEPVGCPHMELGTEAALYHSVGQVCLHKTPVFEAIDLVGSGDLNPVCDASKQEAGEYILETLDSRRRWFSDIRPRRRIISIGDTCLPKTVPTKWGLKKSRSMGELTMPFDLSIHPMPAVLWAISTDFSDYLSEASVVFNSSLDYPTNPAYGIHWNHETGLTWIEDGNAKFNSTYQRRIENFRSAAVASALFFLTTNTAPDSGSISILASTLSQRYGPDIRIAVLCTAADEVQGATNITVEGIDVSKLNLALPSPTYEWWFHEHFATNLGLSWERAIIDWLSELI